MACDNDDKETKSTESILLKVARTRPLPLQKNDDIYASNLKSFPFDDIAISNDVISSDEAEKIMRVIDSAKWVQSISRGRRHQTYNYVGDRWVERNSNGEIMDGGQIAYIVKLLEEKIRKRTNGKMQLRKHQEFFIEEFCGAQVGGDVLETECTCSCDANECKCFVAEISLLNHGVLVFRRPRERSNSCLDCPSHKDTRILVPRNSLFIRTNDCLFSWRSSLCSDGQFASRDLSQPTGILLPNGYGNLIRDESYRRISLKLRSIDVDSQARNTSPITDNMIPLPKNPGLQNEPLQNLLTIVVTTSPIQSNPSLELFQKIFDTFHYAGAEFAFQCNKIIICDGVRLSSGNNVTRKHSNVKQALRNGVASDQQAHNYQLFKNALKTLCDNFKHNDQHSPIPSPFCNTKVVELQERLGYGFALREAVRHHVSTRFVCVIQHDRTFMRQTPIPEVIKTMINIPKIKYVGMSMRSNLMYRDIFSGKYAKNLYDEFDQMILHPEELNLSSEIYGKDGSSARNIKFEKKTLLNNLLALSNSYSQSKQALSHEYLCAQSNTKQKSTDKTQLSLTPTLFWYDNTHIAETAHYRDFIFHPKYKMVKKGGFVEDKVSPNIIKTVERLGLRSGHERFGCYLLDDHSGFFFTGHLDGGSYLIKSTKLQLSLVSDKSTEST